MGRYPTYKRATAAITLLLAALWFGYLLLRPVDGATAGAGIPLGAPAPDFELRTPEGATYRLADLKGQAVMINFFATWCPPCRSEAPLLEEAYAAYREQGFVILAVSPGESDVAIQAFRDRYALTFPIVVDRGGDVSQRYGVIPLPTSYFVDREGIVRGKWTGEIREPELRAMLEQML